MDNLPTLLPHVKSYKMNVYEIVMKFYEIVKWWILKYS